MQPHADGSPSIGSPAHQMRWLYSVPSMEHVFQGHDPKPAVRQQLAGHCFWQRRQPPTGWHRLEPTTEHHLLGGITLSIFAMLISSLGKTAAVLAPMSM